jgi:predicted metal-dependent peptidase
MNQSFIEIEKIIRYFPDAEIDMMQCDTRMVEGSTRTFNRHSFPLTVPHEWCGRGGTELSPAFEYVGKRRAEYDICICLTDMEWSVSDCHNPAMPTIWLSTDKSLSELRTDQTPAFGQVLGPVVLNN